MDEKVVEAIHLTYWLFSLLDLVGVDLVNKRDGSLITFEDVDFEENLGTPTATEQQLVSHVSNEAMEGFVDMPYSSAKINTLRDYVILRRKFPRVQKEKEV